MSEKKLKNRLIKDFRRFESIRGGKNVHGFVVLQIYAYFGAKIQKPRQIVEPLPDVLRRRLWDHAPIANLIGHCVPFPDVYGPFRIEPSLGQGAFNGMPLNFLALRANERAQVTVGIARLDRREFDRRGASGALGTLILCVKHARSLSSGL